MATVGGGRTRKLLTRPQFGPEVVIIALLMLHLLFVLQEPCGLPSVIGWLVRTDVKCVLYRHGVWLADYSASQSL